ncbi:UTP--glucose-1-phosphate uridylyltransferase GalU [Aureibacillus halotolerans]|uniref:UTP--glucose-1-phosphate uridylyltransferase n=1 Tax=Aureibacillus halotolerans TaxID=1508390 RepID=A0A4R6TZ97_9BACI|nr:UTP--glucose-1-phosphate uridylyltransferase GalU [Aureibacillus halotolerans]TDQ38676.1 UDP-glucose pyrophosphorylase [Aureibacillus halotolerans]
MRIKKAIIPAAGMGTRFLPATKAQPKEMLPIVDQPTIQYIVEEAVAAGIEDILIVTGRGKRAIEDHFDKSYELEDALQQRNKTKQLQSVQAIADMANIHYIRQKEPKGLGHAIYCARRFIGSDPFAVLLGDDIVQADTPCMKQLIDIYNTHQASVVGVQEVPLFDVEKYGIVEPAEDMLAPNLVRAKHLVEKPSVHEAPSQYAVMGRYVLEASIFDILETLPPGAGGEIQLTDALNVLSQQQTVLAYNFAGKRYDVGDKAGFIKATIDFALQRDELKDDIRDYLQQVLKQSLVKG